MTDLAQREFNFAIVKRKRAWQCLKASKQASGLMMTVYENDSPPFGESLIPLLLRLITMLDYGS